MNQIDLSNILSQIMSILDNTTAMVIFYIGAAIIVTLLVLLLKKLGENEHLKYEFITIIAHKFRTPLTHLKWISENLIELEQDPYKKSNLQDMQSSNQKLIDLTNTLIELTDAQKSTSSYKFEKYPMGELVKQVAESQKPAFHGKNIFFSVQCEEGPLLAKIDKPRMEFVIQTLLENACMYTPPGKNVDVAVARSGGKIIVSVADMGIGIEKQDLPRIFTKFYRTHAAQLMDTEGFGVGLYLARTIIKRHKGRLEVYSSGKDRGSVFKVILPRARGYVPTPPVPSNPI